MWYSAVGSIVILFLSLLAAPLVAGAQPAGKVPTIGFVTHNTAAQNTQAFEIFAQGLRELGYIDGQTITIERRYVEGQFERVPALVAELATRHIDVFVVTTNIIAKAVQQATPQSPIVMLVAEEPVTSGLVQSLAHPGGTITGMAMVPGAAIYGKNLEFLKEALPPVSRIGVLFHATSVNAPYLHVIEEVAQRLQVTLVPAEVRSTNPSTEDFEAAMAVMKDRNARGFVVVAGPMIAVNTERINELALRHGLAAMWPTRRGAVTGGLLSYGDSPSERWRHAATYVDKILKGAKPGDLPMAQPMNFVLVINLKTAQALGLTIPPSLLFQANEVIR